LKIPHLNELKIAYRYYAYGRQALVEALRLANVLPGDEVLVPALICKDVLSSIHTVGAKPVFYQVDETLAPVLLPNSSLIKAVIAVNYFGFAQDLKPFLDYCKKFSVKLIEDNAHGYLSANVDGVLLGNRAPLGITSIRKTMRIPDGARLHISDKQLSELLPDQLPPQLPLNEKPLGTRYLLQQRFSKVERLTRLPLLRWVRSIVRLRRYLLTGEFIATSTTLAETEVVVPVGPRESSMKQIQKLDEQAEAKRRTELYGRVSSALDKSKITSIHGHLPKNCIPYGFPFFGDTEAARDVQRLVNRFGVEVIRWPDLPEAVVADAPDHYSNLWLVNFL
jgi:hypothetical protein